MPWEESMSEHLRSDALAIITTEVPAEEHQELSDEAIETLQRIAREQSCSLERAALILLNAE